MSTMLRATRSAAYSSEAGTNRSSLVKRLIKAREDNAKLAVRRLLVQHSDELLKSSLGFTDDDLRALRTCELRQANSQRPI